MTGTMHLLGGYPSRSRESPMNQKAPLLEDQTQIEMQTTELEQLRILSETAAHLRSAPESKWAKRRRDEAIRWASQSHSLQSVAAAAEISQDAVADILRKQATESKGPAPRSSERRWSRPLRAARFRTVR